MLNCYTPFTLLYPVGISPISSVSENYTFTELPYDVVCVILRLAVLVQCRRVTDGRTDGQSHDVSLYRAVLA